MRPNLQMLFGTTALVATLLAPGAMQAQTRSENQSQAEKQQQSEQRKQQHAEARRTSQEMSDRGFIEQAAVVNMFEIRAGKLALDRSQDQEVREFSRRIVNDHRRIQDRLTQVAGNANIPSQLDKRHSGLIDRLERSPDDRFDRRFIRMQIRGHEQAIDLFENFIEVRQDQADGGGASRFQDNARSQAGQTAQDQSAQAATRDGRGGSPLLQFAQQNLPALEGHLRSARSIRKTMQSGPDVAANQQSKSQRSSADGRSEQSRTRDGDTARRFVVEQPRPRVTVTDPRSKVNIEQPQPRVTVRQQAPTVTIDQPPPEIVVHMPQPQVDVQDRDPRVSVNVPPPQVHVEQQGGSARVQVQSRSDDAAQVQYERARPQVKFERTGEPRVVYRPTEQEPKVRYESERQEAASTRQQQAASSRSGSTAQSSDAQTGARQSATARREGQDEQSWRDRARQLTSAEETSSTTTGRAKSEESAGANATEGAEAADSATLMLVSRINDMPVYNARGQKLGEVEEVVVDESTNARFVILASGGFLGLFQDEVALPLERFRASGDRLVVSGLTDQDIDNMQDWEDRLPNSSVLDDAQSVRIRK